VPVHDCIVLGVGGVGAATLYHLARRGLRVLGIDRFAPGHDRGSSHGETRVIRQAYFEHPDYVPLLRKARELWKDLEARRGESLYQECGLLQAGPANGVVVPGVLRSAREHGLAVEELSRADTQRRFPGFKLAEGMSVVFERTAGYLRVESCVRAHAEEATRAGAQIIVGEAARSWRRAGSGVEVVTDRGAHTAGALVLCPGAWAPSLLTGLGVPLEVRRKPVAWFQTSSDAYREERGGTCFLFETERGVFYGFPDLPGSGLKAAEHTGGEPVLDPLTVDRSFRKDEAEVLASFLREHLPFVVPQPLRHSVCLYTMSPDEHFIIDRHPDHAAVVFAAGLSGHGFKFTSVLGAVLADFVADGATRLPVDFLSLARFRGRS